MKMFIPEIGTRFSLETDWTFCLYTENRNEALVNASNFPRDACGWWVSPSSKGAAERAGWIVDDEERPCYWKRLHTLPSGTVLSVDRIYIRRGISEYSSVSFNLDRKSVNPDYSMFAQKIANTKGRCRFLAKLSDVNNIEFTLL